MVDHAELLFETDRVRSINDLHIGVHRDNDPGIRFDTTETTLRIGGGDAQSAGGIMIRDTADNPRAFIAEDNGAGSLLVTNSDVDGGVAIDGGASDPSIQVLAGPGITATVDYTADGGRATVSGPAVPEEPVVVAEARPGTTFNGPGGHITVRDSNGDATARLDGRDGTLEVRGGAEVGPDGSEDRVFGGGELLVGTRESPADIHVHVQGEADSDHGVDANNRPRLWFDGPEATLEVGRGPSGTKPGTNGSINLRDGTGTEVLSARATSTGASEVAFQLSASGSPVPRGKIEATADGLLVSMNHPNQPAGQWYHTLLITKQGDIVTKHPIQENVTL